MLVAQPLKEDPMQTTQTTDPNVTLNGPLPSGPAGFFAIAKRYCTVRNGIIAGAVLVLGTAVYLAVTRGDVPDGSVAA
jgi:hypothetical protein